MKRISSMVWYLRPPGRGWDRTRSGALVDRTKPHSPNEGTLTANGRTRLSGCPAATVLATVEKARGEKNEEVAWVTMTPFSLRRASTRR